MINENSDDDDGAKEIFHNKRNKIKEDGEDGNVHGVDCNSEEIMICC